MNGQIRGLIERAIHAGFRNFIIYPYGDVGVQMEMILERVYGISENIVIDNHLNQYNERIREIHFLNELDATKYALLLASINTNIYFELKKALMATSFPVQNIFEFDAMADNMTFKARVGKHSYGALCNKANDMIESIGSFCSFAPRIAVVPNHAMRYITTHPMIYAGNSDGTNNKYEDYKGSEWYFEGITPQGTVDQKKTIIGNDVWLGENVIITNGARIGNGVIAGAGSVITRDVPDYAVVAGVPAHIIRYRFTPEQINSLNRIKWWDWTDEEIRERYDDFYMSIDDFIAKYDNDGTRKSFD